MSRSDIRSSSASVVLWASAFLIAALVIIKAGELPQNAAFAGNASGKVFAFFCFSRLDFCRA